MALRPYWSGQLRLSLVSLPVDVFPALNRSKQIALHEIYRPTTQRVRHQNVVDGKPVDREDIVKGYEIEKGEYVILEPEEIKKLRLPSKETLDIVQFVPADSIDVIYFETPYFIAPDGKAAGDAFVVIREALRASKKVGLGQLVIAGRERLCAIRPCGTGLLLETLRYEDELRKSDPYFEDIAKGSVDKDQLDLAKELIKKKSATFKPSKFHDHYRQALRELIDAKKERRKPRDVVKERPAGNIINLMDALRKSLRTKDGPAKAKKATTRAKTKTKKPTRRKKAA